MSKSSAAKIIISVKKRTIDYHTERKRKIKLLVDIAEKSVYLKIQKPKININILY